MGKKLQAAADVASYLMRRKRGEFFNADGVQLHYTVQGEGDPVILVHGFGADAENNWWIPGITRALAREFKVIALDLRGHGLSDKPHTPEMYGTEMVKDIIRLMDHLEIGKAHVVGYSMGGFITLKLITMFPERLLSAVPCAAGWDRPDAENLALLTAVADSLEAGKGFGPLIVNIEALGKKPSRIKMAITDIIMRWINDQKAMGCIMRRFTDFEVSEEELRRNQVPTLSIAGTIDPLRTGVDNLIGVMANHEAVLVEGGDHMTTIGNDLYIDSVRTFLARHRASS